MANGKKSYRNRLRVVLAEKETTTHWFAPRLDVTHIKMSRSTINKIQPSMSKFVTISKILDVDIYDLIEDSLT